MIACDVDPVAVQIAGLGFVGSADAVASGVADVVAANINPETIVALASDLTRVRRQGGVILASGIEEHELDMVLGALPQVRDVRRKGNWVMVVG